MSISEKSFGFMPDGREVFSYYLDNGKGVKAEIMSYGAIIKSLLVQDKNGDYKDVVLGRDTLEEYFCNNGYFGAAVGRHANRIYRGKFKIGNIEYTASINNGNNSLHGGVKGFDKYVWDTEVQNDTLEMTITSPDGDEGFPGNLQVKVTYTLTENNGLLINYKAVSDRDTVVNLTNHSYFNLNGAGNGDILGHTLQINSDSFTPTDAELIPTGEISPVKGTAMDFNSPKTIGRDIKNNEQPLLLAGGYDHNYILGADREMKLAAEAEGDKSGIVMKVYTDKPGIQLYTGNFLDGSRKGKGGIYYQKNYGFCLETQYYPDSPNNPQFPSCVLTPDKTYNYTTIYKFEIKE